MSSRKPADKMLPSDVGEVADVATPSRKNPVVWSVILLAVGTAWSVGAVFAFLEGGTGATIGGMALSLLAYLCLAFGVARFRMFARNDWWYLRAGPGGLSMHVPGIGFATLVGSYAVVRRDLRWNEVKTWGPVPEKPGAFLSDRVSEAVLAFLMIELNDGTVINPSTVVFAESQFQIAENIRRASAPAA